MSSRDDAAPPGWEVNPSTPGQRAPIVALGLAGLVASAIACAHAWRFTLELWEPFPVVTRNGWTVPAVPVPGPELDLAAFVAIVVLALVGRSDRWRSRSGWTIAANLVVLMTAVSSVLRWSMQFALSGSTSSVFFFTTAVATALIPLSADEMYAALVHRRCAARARARAEAQEGETDYLGPKHMQLGTRASDWTGYASGSVGVLLGLWLVLMAPNVGGIAAVHERIAGIAIIVIAATSLAQVARPVRWLNAAIGLALLVAPLVYPYSMRGAYHAVLVGLFLAMVSVSLSSDGAPSDDRPATR